MQFFFRNFIHILTRTLGKKFEEMFLVKIANKGTSLKFGIKQSKIGRKFTKQWLSKARILGPADNYAGFRADKYAVVNYHGNCKSG